MRTAPARTGGGNGGRSPACRRAGSARSGHVRIREVHPRSAPRRASARGRRHARPRATSTGQAVRRDFEAQAKVDESGFRPHFCALRAGENGVKLAVRTAVVFVTSCTRLHDLECPRSPAKRALPLTCRTQSWFQPKFPRAQSEITAKRSASMIPPHGCARSLRHRPDRPSPARHVWRRKRWFPRGGNPAGVARSRSRLEQQVSSFDRALPHVIASCLGPRPLD